MLWILECPVGLSQKRMCVHFSLPKKQTIVELGSGFELSRPKVAQIVPSRC